MGFQHIRRGNGLGRPIWVLPNRLLKKSGEILALEWSQVDLDEKLVRLNAGETKNDQGRVIPLVPELVELLKM